MTTVANIVNPNLANQLDTGSWLEKGFRELGYDIRTTADRKASGDITIVHGPNYALRGSKGLVLWLDRCWYGNKDEWVSLGWKLDNGARAFATGDENRLLQHIDTGIVEIEPMRHEGKTIALDDFAQTVRASGMLHDTYRGHPAREKHTTTLHGAMLGHQFAVCGSGTCAAQAKLAGLHVLCLDPSNIVHSKLSRWAWACELAWTQWHRREIESGKALRCLLDIL